MYPAFQIREEHLLTESKKTYLGKGIQSTFSQFLKMEMNVTVPITVICDKENKNLRYRVIFPKWVIFSQLSNINFLVILSHQEL